MSLDTWKEEFYFTPETDFASMTDLEAAKHSLRKWSGATKENCDKHQVIYQVNVIFDLTNDDALQFDLDTCALCAKYCTDLSHPCTVVTTDGEEIKCPIYEHLGQTCDGDSDTSPVGMSDTLYRKSAHDPQPMIDILTSIVEKLQSALV